VDKLPRALQVTARGGHQNADHDERAEDVHDKGLKVEIEAPAHDRGAEVRVERDDRRRNRQHDKAVADEPVEQPRVSLARRATLRDGVLEHELDALGRAVEARRGLPTPPAAYVTIDAVSRHQRRRHQQRVHHPQVGDVPVNLARGVGRVHGGKAVSRQHSAFSRAKVAGLESTHSLPQTGLADR
jgi:hypothetical protein